MYTLKILLLSFILAISCFAQQKDSLGKKDPLSSYRWAVQFEVGNDFTLRSFDGLIVSLKYHFSPKVALRFGVGANVFSADENWEHKEYYSGFTVDEPIDYDYRNYLLIANVLFYPNPGSVLKVYFGGGPRATHSYSFDEYLYDDFRYRRQYERSSWSVGLNGVFGCEWFPIEFLSLFGEYSVYGTYGESTSEEYSLYFQSGQPFEYNEYTSQEFIFRGNIARLGASFYF